MTFAPLPAVTLAVFVALAWVVARDKVLHHACAVIAIEQSRDSIVVKTFAP